MELIIKPTGLCNMNCTFCSAANLDIAHPSKVPNQIKELIQKLKPNSIIVTGGEPLTIDPSYYWELLDIAQCHIGFTSNMKDFYLNPNKWKDIIQHPNFDFITSFNYGETRLWDPTTPYSEEMFRKVHKIYTEISNGKSLNFIAVIDKSNENTIMDHIYLAKDLNCKVKINGACKIGRQGINYPKYKIIKFYLDLIDMGLDQYEITCCERHLGRCALNTNFMCQSAIRCCYVDHNDKLHYGICDDLISAGIEIPMDDTFPLDPKPEIPKLQDHINNKCVYCDLFRFCHGCIAHREHAKEFPEHCEEMLKLKDRLIKTGWKL